MQSNTVPPGVPTPRSVLDRPFQGSAPSSQAPQTDARMVHASCICSNGQTTSLQDVADEVKWVAFGQRLSPTGLGIGRVCNYILI